MSKKASPVLSKRYFSAVVLLSLFLFSIYSQDLEPRVYANVAKDLNVVAVGYGFVDVNVLTESSLPVADFTFRVTIWWPVISEPLDLPISSRVYKSHFRILLWTVL